MTLEPQTELALSVVLRSLGALVARTGGIEDVRELQRRDPEAYGAEIRAGGFDVAEFDRLSDELDECGRGEWLSREVDIGYAWARWRPFGKAPGAQGSYPPIPRAARTVQVEEASGTTKHGVAAQG